jgi:ubiquinone/menaquinone biosynthesis C-methylase UbiE
MNKHSQQPYIPALKYHALTGLYDAVVQLTTREVMFKTELVNFAAPQAGEHVLDVGCGTGTLTYLLAEREPTLRIMGLDADPMQLKSATKKVAAISNQISFQQGYAQQLPDKTLTFDIVVSSLFFHHLTTHQKRQALAEILRVLKPGGRLHIADWGKPSSGIQRLMFFIVQLLDGFDTTRDSVEGNLPNLMKEAGFADVENSRFVPTFLGTVQLFQAKKPRKQLNTTLMN